MLKAAAEGADRELAACIYDAVGGPHWHPPSDVPITEILYDLRTDLMPHTPVWRAVAKCDVILDIGAGELSSDIYGGEFSFAVFCSRMVALAQNKRMVLSPQTIGPFKSEYLQSLMEQVIRRCDQTFTRDGESLRYLKNIGVVEGVQECIDLAFGLPFESQPKAPDTPIRVGLNVSGLLYLEATVNRFSFGLKADYPVLIDRIIRALMPRQDVELILVPHCVAEGTINRHADDVWICEKLAKDFGLPIAPRFGSPVEAKSFISSLDLLAASRLHATIAAVSSGVPVIPLGHTRKFTGVFESIEYPLVCDLRSNDEETALGCVLNGLSQVADLRAAAERSNQIAQAKLSTYQAYLDHLMLSLP